jgi:hypothetical protein
MSGGVDLSSIGGGGLPKAGKGKGGGGGGGLSDTAQQAKDLQQRIKDLNLQIQFFGDDSLEAAERQRQLSEGIKAVNQPLADQAIAAARQLDALKAEKDALEKAKQARDEYAKSLAQAKSGITNSSFNTNVDLKKQLDSYSEQISLGRELNDVERQRIANAADLIQKQQEWRTAGFTDADIEQLSGILTEEQKRTLEILKQVQAKKELLEATKPTKISARISSKLSRS